LKYAFLDPEYLEDDEQIVGIGGDLNPNRLILAYEMGIFPWFSEDEPILWWSPNPRFILYLDDFKISHSLKKSIKKFEVKFDYNFEQVIANCASIKRAFQDGTWITSDMIKAYTKLHKKGFAHSIECYFEGTLVGGLYGVSLGGAFFGESMFSLKSDASKVALAVLVQKLKLLNFDFIDCQVSSNHLASLGAKEIERKIFLKELKLTLKKSSIISSWREI